MEQFKEGDIIIALSSSEPFPKEGSIIKDQMFKVIEYDSLSRWLKFEAFFTKELNSWHYNRFRLATPAEVRRYKGFNEELETILNE